ncbi:MAG: lipid-A-disaccharide synthase [Alphaproteobacteria bacterium]
MKLFFIVGEDSGDALAAPLIRSLREGVKEDGLECVGIGGALMKNEGFETLLPMDQISASGIWEVLPKLHHLLKIKKAIVEEIELRQPDAVITVDFPDFNFHIAKALKKRQIFKGKIIHYVAPTVWAWRPGRAKKVAEFLDGMMCLFPMEPKYFTAHKLKAVHVGHPLAISRAKEASSTMFREENNIPDNSFTLGLFFGSRENEFKKISPAIKTAARLINDVESNLHIISPTLPRLEYDVQKILQGFDLPVYVTANPNVKWEAIKACNVAVAVSGTAALELAYAGVPHVICYKVNPVTALILKVMMKIKHVHLANILLEKEVVPEFLQGNCNPEKIANKVVELMQNKSMRQEQVDQMKALDDKLNPDDTLTPPQLAAQFIIDTVRSQKIRRPKPAQQTVEKIEENAVIPPSAVSETDNTSQN